MKERVLVKVIGLTESSLQVTIPMKYRKAVKISKGTVMLATYDLDKGLTLKLTPIDLNNICKESET